MAYCHVLNSGIDWTCWCLTFCILGFNLCCYICPQHSIFFASYILSSLLCASPWGFHHILCSLFHSTFFFQLPCTALHCLWYVPSQLWIKVCSCYNLQNFVVIVVWFPIASLFVLYTCPLRQALCYQFFFTLSSVFFMNVAISFLSCNVHHHLCT